MLRKVSLYIMVFVLPSLIMGGVYLYFRWSGTTSRAERDSMVFQNGDLIFRRGKSVESFAVCLADRDHDFSHIGIVVVDQGQPFVIHAVPGESDQTPSLVVKEPVNDFLDNNKASHWAVYRSRLSAGALKKVTARAWTFFVSRTGFDNDYDLTSDTRVYCSELVMKSYMAAGLDPSAYPLREVKLITGAKRILFPGAFTKSPDFRKVCSF